MEYQFKIRIRGIVKPPVWRKISVPSNFTFLQLHQVLQVTFGWKKQHCFKFVNKLYPGRLCICLPKEEDAEMKRCYDASTITLSEIFKHFNFLLYVYDLHEKWIHELFLSSETDENREKACCLFGKGACPSEDSYDAEQYEHIKNEILHHPESSEAIEIRKKWGLKKDEEWSPGTFDIDQVNAQLQGI